MPKIFHCKLYCTTVVVSGIGGSHREPNVCMRSRTPKAGLLPVASSPLSTFAKVLAKNMYTRKKIAWRERRCSGETLKTGLSANFSRVQIRDNRALNIIDNRIFLFLMDGNFFFFLLFTTDFKTKFKCFFLFAIRVNI